MNDVVNRGGKVPEDTTMNDEMKDRGSIGLLEVCWRQTGTKSFAHHILTLQHQSTSKRHEAFCHPQYGNEQDEHEQEQQYHVGHSCRCPSQSSYTSWYGWNCCRPHRDLHPSHRCYQGTNPAVLTFFPAFLCDGNCNDEASPNSIVTLDCESSHQWECRIFDVRRVCHFMDDLVDGHSYNNTMLSHGSFIACFL